MGLVLKFLSKNQHFSLKLRLSWANGGLVKSTWQSPFASPLGKGKEKGKFNSTFFLKKQGEFHGKTIEVKI